VLGNLGTRHDDVLALDAASQHEDPLVREHALCGHLHGLYGSPLFGIPMTWVCEKVAKR